MLKVKCKICTKVVELKVKREDFEAWQNGELIQNAMPYLTRGEREILISGICEACFSSLFKEEEEGDSHAICQDCFNYDKGCSLCLIPKENKCKGYENDSAFLGEQDSYEQGSQSHEIDGFTASLLDLFSK